MENREHQTFHVGLKAFLTQGNKLLILQDTDGFWELPGGRTEKAEIYKPLPEILRREVDEELGSQIQYDIGPLFHAWIRKPEPTKENIDQVYQNTDFCIFLVGFHCKYISGDIHLSPEHRAFRWIDKGEVENLEFENTYKEAAQKYFENL